MRAEGFADVVVEAGRGHAQAERVAEEPAVRAVLVEIDFLVAKIFGPTQASHVADKDEVRFEVARDQPEEEAQTARGGVKRFAEQCAFKALGRKVVNAAKVFGERRLGGKW